ncbi:MAG: imidazole glycerol phosphate synthase subunit HisH [Clostridia bacterium]|nr:imidazole glycerol phosphate synthase subunit HisH [Clostridia bacterium]
MIAVIDYGAGNLLSVEKAFRYLGYDCAVTDNAYIIKEATHVVLPGVGSFGDCCALIREKNLYGVIEEVVAAGTPFLGICLGMQLLFDKSEESPDAKGLGVFRGTIKRLPEIKGLKIPHMGWNTINCRGKLFRNLESSPYVYFVHSYYLDACDKTIVSATADYGTSIDAAVECNNVFGVQFHPEKSGEAGLLMLKNFAGGDA